MGLLVFLSVILLSVRCKVYFHEKVDDGFLDRWTQSSSTSVSKHGKLAVIKSEYNDGDYYVKTSEDSSHYQYGTEFKEPLDTSANDLIFQFVVHHTQQLDCGGAYIKLLPSGTDFKQSDGNTPYSIMFGPDFCGYSTRKIHVIFNHGGKNHEIVPEIPMVLDRKPHLYTLILHKNKSIEVLVDGEVKRNATVADDFTILPPKIIPDPSDKKPEDWVDDEYIVDPNEKKPADWVDQETIIDPNATKPSDWNDESDGEWQADSIPNPQYKGKWEPPTIKNPAFKGVWEARKIPNPEFKEDPTVGNYIIQAAFIEVWQVKSGTLFDEFYISDNIDEAKEHAAIIVDALKKISEEIEKKEAEEREKLNEEAAASRKSSGEEEDKELAVDDDEEETTSTVEDDEVDENRRDDL